MCGCLNMKFRRLADVYLPIEKHLKNGQSTALAEASLASNIFGTPSVRRGREIRASLEDYRNQRLRYGKTPGYSSGPILENSKYGRWLEKTSKVLVGSDFLVVAQVAEPSLAQFLQRKVRARVPGASVFDLSPRHLNAHLWLLENRNSGKTVFEYFTSPKPVNFSFTAPSYLVLGTSCDKEISAAISSFEKDEAEIVLAAISAQLVAGQEGLMNAITSIETPWKRVDPKFVKIAETLRTLAAKDLTKASVGLGNFLVLTRP